MVDDHNKLRKYGYCGPFDLAGKDKCQAMLAEIKRPNFLLKDAHLHSLAARIIISDVGLRAKVKDFFGEQLYLWRTNFFLKDPEKNIGEVKWHHEKHFQSAEEALDFDEIASHFSVIIALSDMTSKNGAFEVIPKTHMHISEFDRDTRPYHLKKPDEHYFTPPKDLMEKRITIEMQQGQFLLFHSALIHGSLPYVSGEPRVSMIGRLVRKNVALPHYIKESGSVVDYIE